MSGSGDPRGAGAGGGARRPVTARDVPHLDFVDEVFLPEAVRWGYITGEQDEKLRLLARELRIEAQQEVRPVPADLPEPVGAPYAVTAPPRATAAPAPSVPAPLPAPSVRRRPAAWPAPQPPPASPAAPAAREVPAARAAEPAPRPREPRPPSAVRLWWDRTRQAVSSDLAVHGLAYLGVLLFFVGAFGLVAFAFGDVAPSMRPLAELVIAGAPFAAGVLLRRRRAEVVGRALEVAGGLVLPVMVVTSFVDGVDVPPDLTGTSLVVVLTLLVVALAAAYAAWSRRVPDSALRYLVAPLLWLAVGLASMGVGQAVPQGRDVAVPSAWQAALMTAALAVSVLVARLLHERRWAGPVLVSAVPGLVVLAVLDVLTWLPGDAPAAAVLTGGLSVLVALEGLAPRLGKVPGVAEPSWWALVVPVTSGAAGVQAGLDATVWVWAVGALGFLCLLERADAVRRPAPARLLSAIGLGLALFATIADPRWSSWVFGVATAWAAWRRGHPYAARRAGRTLDVCAALFPLVTVASVSLVRDPASTLLVGGAFLLLLAVPAARGWLDRSPDDGYWRVWFSSATVLASTLVLTTWSELSSVGSSAWVLAGAAGLVAVAAAVGPFSRTARPAAVLVPAVLAWLAVARALELQVLLEVSVPALAALGLVVLAHWSPSPLTPHLAASTRLGLAVAGLVVGTLVALLAVFTGWGLVVAVAASTAGWGLTGWLDAADRSPVGSALRRSSLTWLPLVLAAGGVPIVVLLAADRSRWLALDGPWASVLLAAVAVAYAVSTRLRVPDRVGATAGWAAFVLGVLAPVTAHDRWPAAVALGALVLAVALLARQRRVEAMVWTAWLAPAPAALLCAEELSSWFDRQPLELQGAMALVVVGSGLLVGAAAADLRGRAWEPRLLPAHEALQPPAGIGVVETAGGTVLAVLAVAADGSSGSAAGGWVTALAAVAFAITAVLARAGALAALAVVVGWVSALLLGGDRLQAHPWVAAVAAAGVLAAAQALSWRSPAPVGGRWWTRWDVPVLVAAAPVAATGVALSATVTGTAGDVTFVAVGVECALVAARLRRVRVVVAKVLAVVGGGLVILGAGRAGPGWLAVALLVLSVVLTVLTARAARPARYLFRAAAVVTVVLTWLAAVDWLDWPAQRTADTTALGAAALTAAAAAVAMSRRVDREWAVVWGSAAALAEVAVAALSLLPGGPVAVSAGWPLVGGLAVVAAALLVSSAVVDAPWQREVGSAYAFGAVAAALEAAVLAPTTRVWVLCAVGVLCALALLALLALGRGRWAVTWRGSFVVLGWGVTLLALAMALGRTDPPLLAPPLAVASLEAIAAGVVLRSLALQLLAPALAGAAWAVFALQSLGGDPQGVVAPLGLATLVAVGLWRRDRRSQGEELAVPMVVAVERFGILLLVGPSLAAALTTSVAYAVIAAALGCLVCVWAGVTRVRRRLLAGALVVGISLVLLVGVPLVHLLPSWGGATLWVLIGGLGLVAVLVAALLERGKAAVRTGLQRLERATIGWE